MKRVSTSELVPGMITAEDILNYNHQLVLPKGLILTDKMITKLTFYSIFHVYVEDEIVEFGNFSDHAISYTEKLRQTSEFIQFKKDFEKDVDVLKDAVNDVIERGAPIDIDKLINNTLKSLDSNATGPGIFDMLHCMREYDDATYVHCMNVALICNVFAHWLRLSDEEIRTATISGLLHDIGKTRIPDSIIKKPSALSPQEYSIVKTHPQEGYRMLEKSAVSPSIRNAVLMHHERWDGSGYPFGITGDKIDPYAKIVAIADVYDAMTSARIYRGPLCPFKAIAIFENEGLQKYDPKYILTFLENVVNTYLLNIVRLNNGVVGKIVYINRDRLSSPTIQTANGFIDLSIHSDLYIEDIL